MSASADSRIVPYSKDGESAEKLAQQEKRAAELLAKLEARRIRASAPPSEPVTRIFVAGKPIATPGNLVAIISKAKTGKTASVGAMVAAAIAASIENLDADTLHFTASNPNGKALILIDTEQSPFDAHACYMRSLGRAGADSDPSWLHAYSLAGWSAQDLWSALRPALEHGVKSTGGVFAVVLDGVADFVSDVNDPHESNAFVAELHGLAIEYDCSLVCIIHSNEAKTAGDDGRGHLGKQLTRKAESNLLLKKVGDVTTITSEKQRKAPITEADGVAFKWSDTEGRHVSCEAPGTTRDAQKTAELRDLANEVFGTDRQLRRMELERRIGDARNLKGNTPGRRVDAMKVLGVIRVTTLGFYERVT